MVPVVLISWPPMRRSSSTPILRIANDSARSLSKGYFRHFGLVAFPLAQNHRPLLAVGGVNLFRQLRIVGRACKPQQIRVEFFRIRNGVLAFSRRQIRAPRSRGDAQVPAELGWQVPARLQGKAALGRELMTDNINGSRRQTWLRKTWQTDSGGGNSWAAPARWP